MVRIKIHISKEKLPFYPLDNVKCRLQNEVSTECPVLKKLEKRMSMYESDTKLCNQYLTMVNA